MTRRVGASVALTLAVGLLAGGGQAAAATAANKVQLEEFRVSEGAMKQLRERWYRQLERKYGRNTWAPMRMELGDAELKLMGLPSKKVLLSRRYARPTAFRNGRAQELNSAVISFAGAGYFGIRPGAWLLLMSGGGIGWCSAAHVYGSPGNYAISTAGHCGRNGDIATVIGVVGNNTPVLIDFGKFTTSHDGGLGADHAKIDIFPEYQKLVTPTMAFWGGPRGVFTKQGAVAGVSFPRKGIVPNVSVNPDPFLAQQLLHYGHGTGVGAGGTPRSGTAIHWGSNHYMFFGAISPGDSGSGANTAGGDTIGAANEAAGIMTHLWVDPLMRQGLGIMGGTRTTVVGTPADGQLVGYPAPAPILP